MKHYMRPVFLIVTLTLLLAVRVKAGPNPPTPPPYQKPKPPPANISSSETVFVLPPPPVTPVKRQEKKNPPRPPALITKIKSNDEEDWARTPNDLKGLLEWMSGEMSVNFTSKIASISEISSDPAENPVLYRSGYKPFTLSSSEIQRLRAYLLAGGTVIFNPLVGHPDAYESAKKAALAIFPEQQLYRLRTDHPIFSSYFPIDTVNFSQRMVRDGLAADNHPYLEGIDIDNRTAIIISRWDFSLGWSKSDHESWGYADQDARRLGANIVSYATAMKKSAQSVGKSVVLADADKNTASKVKVGQLKHNGPWKTRESAFPMLLNELNKTTGAQVSYGMDFVGADDKAIFEMPFLFLTGTTDFAFTDEETLNLRQFLSNGGVLFVEAGEGRDSFDNAFKREIRKILPDASLTRLDAAHPIFNAPNHVGTVKARPALAVRNDQHIDIQPELYGAEVNGSLAVIYSPYDLSAGWEKAVAPYALGYEAKSAMDLGINVFYYALTR
jgi:hypothetical protein